MRQRYAAVTGCWRAKRVIFIFYFYAPLRLAGERRDTARGASGGGAMLRRDMPMSEWRYVAMSPDAICGAQHGVDYMAAQRGAAPALR